MGERNVKELKISCMTIEKNVMSWEGHGLRMEGISRIWVGGVPEKSFPYSLALIMLLVALSGPTMIHVGVMLLVLGVCLAVYFTSRKSVSGASEPDSVNLELCSGKIYSFAVESQEFAGELYELLKQLMAEGGGSSQIEVVFRDGEKIIDHSQDDKPLEAPNIMEVTQAAGSKGQIVEELKKLYGCYTKKTDIDSGILALINEAGSLIEKNDKAGLKDVFSRFVTSGLINDCNELGLDSLLQEIRTMVY